jgi:hypothetical protein
VIHWEIEVSIPKEYSTVAEEDIYMMRKTNSLPWNLLVI